MALGGAALQTIDKVTRACVAALGRSQFDALEAVGRTLDEDHLLALLQTPAAG